MRKAGRVMQQGGRLKGAVIIGLMLVQAACAAFFVVDVWFDYLDGTYGSVLSRHLVAETLANVLLVGAIVFEAAYLRTILRQQAHTERVLTIASGAMRDAMTAYFDDWGLTPAEAAVAELAIKGKSISDIAATRGSAEGTIKTQLNSVYRKLDAKGRDDAILVATRMGLLTRS